MGMGPQHQVRSLVYGQVGQPHLILVRTGLQFTAPVEKHHRQPGTPFLHFGQFLLELVGGPGLQGVDSYQPHRDPFHSEDLAFFIAEGHDPGVSQGFEGVPVSVVPVVVTVVVGQGGGFHAAGFQHFHIGRVSPEGEGLVLTFSPGGEGAFHVHQGQVVLVENGPDPGQEYGAVTPGGIPGFRKSPFIAETFLRAQGAVPGSTEGHCGDGVCRRLGRRSRCSGGGGGCWRNSRSGSRLGRGGRHRGLGLDRRRLPGPQDRRRSKGRNGHCQQGQGCQKGNEKGRNGMGHTAGSFLRNFSTYHTMEPDCLSSVCVR